MEGIEICSKCNGKKVITEFPSDDNPRLQSPLVKECDKCNGKGKLDWVSNAMTSKIRDFVSTFSFNAPPADVLFSVDNGRKEMLKICENGDFFVKGKKVVNDKQVYEGFIKFLKESGYYI